MDEEMLQCAVRMPIGNTAGELIRRGAIMENRHEVDGLQCFDAAVPAGRFEPFKKWLEVHTGGAGWASQK